jgi:hypothetical protein
MNTTYKAIRALNELDALRASDDWAGDTVVLPALGPAIEDDEPTATLPALVRKQAE